MSSKNMLFRIDESSRFLPARELRGTKGSRLPTLPMRWTHVPRQKSLSKYVIIRADRIPPAQAHVLEAELAGRPVLDYCLDLAADWLDGGDIILAHGPGLDISGDTASRVHHLLRFDTEGPHTSNTSFQDVFPESAKGILRIEIDPRFPFLTKEDLQKSLHIWSRKPWSTLVSASFCSSSIWHYHRMEHLTPRRLMGNDPKKRYQGFRQFDRPLYKINNAIRISACTYNDNIIQLNNDKVTNLSIYTLSSRSAIYISTEDDLIYANAFLKEM